jgi:hypothetical protein
MLQLAGTTACSDFKKDDSLSGSGGVENSPKRGCAAVGNEMDFPIIALHPLLFFPQNKSIVPAS